MRHSGLRRHFRLGGQIYPYVKSTAVFACPDESIPNSPLQSVPAALHESNASSSYAINRNISTSGGSSCTDLNHTSASLSQFNAPANTVLLFEMVNSNEYNVAVEDNTVATGGAFENCGGSPSGNGSGYQYDVQGYNGPPNGIPASQTDTTLHYATGVLNGISGNNANAYTPTPRHTDGANYLMSDNHAKFFRPGTVSPGDNAATETAVQVNNQTAAGTSGTFADKTTHPAVTFSLL